jgi:hypothetical protein
MSIKKQYLKSKPVCKVTFRLPEDAAGEQALILIRISSAPVIFPVF